MPDSMRPRALQIEDVELFEFPLQTRLPFRYGMAEMRSLPHCLLRVRVRIGSRSWIGHAADHLPPRWFTKRPEQTESEEQEELWQVIRHAARSAIGAEAPSAFAWWRDAYEAQLAWGHGLGLPPLLAHFGVTLVERAVIDAVCEAEALPFHDALRRGLLGFDPAAVHPALAGFEWKADFPEHPLRRVFLRQTLGLGDPVSAADLPADARLGDGLPETLSDMIAAYGLRHFKIKLSGAVERDRAQLDRIHRCLESCKVEDGLFTLDGNEQFA
ncbi:MAG: hypothetical protein ACLFU2_14635, partial [Opitutales bacterium]